ncbi:MAG: PLP-dependent transferase [Terriglobales bacterium]
MTKIIEKPRENLGAQTGDAGAPPAAAARQGGGHDHLRPRTQVLTRGFDPRLSVGSARPAVFRSSTYVFSSPEAAERAFALSSGRAQPAPGEQAELIYSRLNHPNAEILEDQVVPLEAGATGALVFNSGMAAITTALLAFAKPAQTIIYTVPIYGGTQHFIQDFLAPLGVRQRAVPAGDTAALTQAIAEAEDLAVVLVETPANPTLVMTDIHAAAAAASQRQPRPVLMVDNTLLGPTFQHPLPCGTDLCLYSATKYLSGFSDLIGGMAIAARPELIPPMRGLRTLLGNILQPDECWILDGHLPTVHLRMTRACENAQVIAQALARHPAVAKVNYPTLFRSPDQVKIYRAQCDAPGAMISFEARGGKAAAFDFLRALRLGRDAVSLGGVETLACHPMTTTHSGFTPEQFAAAGVTDGLVRLSIGIEDAADLQADFEQALDRIGAR